MRLSLTVAAVLLSSAPGLALAQTRAPTDRAPTANDPSVGTPSPPAANLSNPVGLAPQAARKEGASPETTKNGPIEGARDKR